MSDKPDKPEPSYAVAVVGELMKRANEFHPFREGATVIIIVSKEDQETLVDMINADPDVTAEAISQLAAWLASDVHAAAEDS